MSERGVEGRTSPAHKEGSASAFRRLGASVNLDDGYHW